MKYEVYEWLRNGDASVYAQFKYIEHANYLCERLKQEYGTDTIYVRTIKR